MKAEISEICGNYKLALDGGIDLFFNSRQNALNVKRIIEADESVPNAATVCDMVEVVRCKDCANGLRSVCYKEYVHCRRFNSVTKINDFCSCGEKRGMEMFESERYSEAIKDAKKKLQHKPTKEDARELLWELGIIDKEGNVTEDYADTVFPYDPLDPCCE